MAQVDTGGGATVGRDANAGRDFVGRDSVENGASSSRVDLHLEGHREAYSDTQILQNLQQAILGDPYNPSRPGVLKSVIDLSVSIDEMLRWREGSDAMTADLRRDIDRHRLHAEFRLDTTDSRLSQFMVIMWVTLSVVGLEAIALIWLFVQLSVLGF